MSRPNAAPNTGFVPIDTPPTTAPSAEAYRLALRHLVGQVSVITVLPNGDESRATGLTLTSANALSTQPPMLIACINRAASAHAALHIGAVIGWQSLGAAHQALAERFSGKGGAQGPARFSGAEWCLDQGAKLLIGAPLACAAEIDSLADHATHTVITARILSLHSAPDAGVLAYRDGTYLTLN